MRARIELRELEAINSGEAVAEPQLWVVFFKIDDSTLSTVLAQKLERGKLDQAELDRRDILGVERAEAASNSSFHALGRPAGELKPMRTGDVQELNLAWEVDLESGGIGRTSDAVIGAFVIGWELDNRRFAGSEERYAEFEASVSSRVLRSVARIIEAQVGGRGPFAVPVRSSVMSPAFAAGGEDGGASFVPQDHEREIAQHYAKRPRGVGDSDDLLGILVAAAQPAGGAAPVSGDLLWSGTANSEEGVWRIRWGASLVG